MVKTKENIKEWIENRIANNPQMSIKPLFLHCAIRWDDEDTIDNVNYETPSNGYADTIICVMDSEMLNSYPNGIPPFDDKVVYYIPSIEQLLTLVDYNNGSDFHLIDYFYCEKI